MLKSEKTTINGVGYEVTQLPYKFGHKLLLRLYKILAPAVGRILAEAPQVSKGVNLVDVQVKDFAPALSAALESTAQQLSEDDFDYVVDTLKEYTKISKTEGKWVPLAQEMEFHFAGNYGELFKWVGFALKVNYAGFMSGRGSLGDLLERVAAMTAQKSQSTSTGTPTE